MGPNSRTKAQDTTRVLANAARLTRNKGLSVPKAETIGLGQCKLEQQSAVSYTSSGGERWSARGNARKMGAAGEAARISRAETTMERLHVGVRDAESVNHARRSREVET